VTDAADRAVELAERDRQVLDEHLRLLDGGAHFLQALPMRDVPPTTGDFAMELDVTPSVKNPRGGVQGGLVATLADIVAGRALLDGLPAGHLLTTADLSIKYLASNDIGPVRAEATVIRRGRHLCIVQVDITDTGSGRLTAIATLSFSVLARRGAAVPTTTPEGNPAT
jgi:uncharacterized protein (TIGR00369 family)